MRTKWMWCGLAIQLIVASRADGPKPTPTEAVQVLVLSQLESDVTNKRLNPWPRPEYKSLVIEGSVTGGPFGGLHLSPSHRSGGCCDWYTTNTNNGLQLSGYGTLGSVGTSRGSRGRR